MTYLLILVAVVVIGLIIGALAGTSSNKQTDERGEKLSAIASNLADFNPSTTIAGVKNFYKFIIDNEHRNVCYVDERESRVIPFEDIINVELIENGTTLSTKSTMRTIGGSLVGGAVAGGAGAIVGGLSGNSKQIQKFTDVQIRMRIRDLNNPVLLIKCFDAKTMTVEGKPVKPDSLAGWSYKEGKEHAQRILDLVSVIIDDVDKKRGGTQSVSSEDSTSIADELAKLSDLKAKGVLTQEEFDQQKEKLLSKG